MDDVGLVRAAVAGDRNAFGAIYDAYADRVHAFATSVLRDPDEAADVTQDTFLVAARRLDQLRDPSKLRPWLFAIARHEAFRRSKKRQRHVLTDEMEDQVSLDRSAEDIVTGQDAATIVREAAAGLTERDRAVLDLSLRHGLEGEELGAAMGISAGHASVLAGRVRDRVEKSLGALLVARLGRDDCAELQDVLGDWDGSFSPLVRKRVARHVEGCEVCSATKRRVASPAALLSSAPIVAVPTGLRGRVMEAYDAHVAASTPTGPGGSEGSSGSDVSGTDVGSGSGAEASSSTPGDPSAPSTSTDPITGASTEPVPTIDATPPPVGDAAATPPDVPPITPVAAPIRPTPHIHLDRNGFPRSSGRGKKALAVVAVLVVLLGVVGIGRALVTDGDDEEQAVTTGEQAEDDDQPEDVERTITVVQDEGPASDGPTTTLPLGTPVDPNGDEPTDDPDLGGGSDPSGGGGGGQIVPPPTQPPPPPPPADTTPPNLRVFPSNQTIRAGGGACPAGSPSQATINITAGDPSGVSITGSSHPVSGGGGAWTATLGPYLPISPTNSVVTFTVTVTDGAGNSASGSANVTVVC